MGIKKIIQGFNEFKQFVYERNQQGEHWNVVSDGTTNWSDLSNRMDVVSKHPILLPIFKLYSNYLSVVEFTVDGKADHPLIQKLSNPNQYQSKQDFLKQFMWFYLGYGYLYQYVKKPSGFKEAEHANIYNLRTDLLEYDKNFKTPIGSKISDFKKTSFIYDPKEEKLELTFKDVIRYHDLPTVNDYARSKSRLDSHKEAISNIQKAFDAKNIIIGSNGREMFTNGSANAVQAMPIRQEEKKDIETKLMRYGLGKGKRRGVVVNNDVTWKSLHIPLKELGLDESVIKDATILLNANGVPSELISYADRQPKYENRLMAEIGFVQREIQPIADDIANSIGEFFDVKIDASFDHMPIMQKVEKTRVEKLTAHTTYLDTAVKGGMITIEEAKKRFKDYENGN